MASNSYDPYAPSLDPTAPPRPGRRGIVLGIALLVIGPIVGTVVILTSVLGAVSAVTHAPTYSTEQSARLDLTGGTTMGIWTDQGSDFAVIGSCTVSDAAGKAVALVESGWASQDINRFSLSAKFTPPADGTYDVVCKSWSANFQFRVAPPVAGGRLALGIVGGVLGILIFVFGGIALIVVTLAHRSTWDRTYGPNAEPPPQSVYPPQPYPA